MIKNELSKWEEFILNLSDNNKVEVSVFICILQQIEANYLGLVQDELFFND